eukprot:Nk52_evm21s287 gene=Nk52_evmTU21s287
MHSGSDFASFLSQWPEDFIDLDEIENALQGFDPDDRNHIKSLLNSLDMKGTGKILLKDISKLMQNDTASNPETREEPAALHDSKRGTAPRSNSKNNLSPSEFGFEEEVFGGESEPEEVTLEGSGEISTTLSMHYVPSGLDRKGEGGRGVEASPRTPRPISAAREALSAHKRRSRGSSVGQKQVDESISLALEEFVQGACSSSSCRELLKDRLDELKESCSSQVMKSVVNLLSSVQEYHQEDMMDRDTKIMKLKEEREKELAAISKLQKECVDYKEEIEDKEQKIHELESEVSNASDKISRLKSKYAEVNEERLHALSVELNQTKDLLKSSEETFKAQYDQLKRENEMFEEEHTKLKEDKIGLESRIEKLQGYKDESALNHHRAKQMEIEMATLKQEFEAEKDSLIKDVEVFRTSNKELEDANEQLRDALLKERQKTHFLRKENDLAQGDEEDEQVERYFDGNVAGKPSAPRGISGEYEEQNHLANELTSASEKEIYSLLEEREDEIRVLKTYISNLVTLVTDKQGTSNRPASKSHSQAASNEATNSHRSSGRKNSISERMSVNTSNTPQDSHIIKSTAV